MIVCGSLFISLFWVFLFLFSSAGGCALWVREGELMENVKLACSAALAVTRADCGVTPVVLPLSL